MKTLYLLSIFFPFIIALNGQTITEDLKVRIGEFELEVSKTKMGTVAMIFAQDSVINIDFEGSYIFKHNKLEFLFCDKNGDSILDMIVLYSKDAKTWNNINIGVDYITLKKEFPVGVFGINNDCTNYIAYSYQPKGEREIGMSFYFETLKHEVYSEELSQKEYEEILLDNSKLMEIVINNPN